MFGYRDRFLRGVLSGPQRDPGVSGELCCHCCGTESVVQIERWVAAAFPACDGVPRYTLESQAILNGWMVAPAQIATGQGMTSIDLAFCPECVDELLHQAATRSSSGMGRLYRLSGHSLFRGFPVMTAINDATL